ncbi:transmembrane protein 104-like isoform X2 [Gigantopelta aegis]|nr:transmembrane protein 104-like isoform X2 [Gigantopelta aegis]
MAAANAVLAQDEAASATVDDEQTIQKHHRNENIIEHKDEVDEKAPLLPQQPGCVSTFEIKKQVEMGQMAKLFFNPVGEKLFYLCIAIYLYGDLSIYAAAVPKSLRDTVCTWRPNLSNLTFCNGTFADTDPCWRSISLSRMDVYRIFVACFLLTVGPFAFFNIQKTKYLQITTTLARWLAFGIMIILAINKLAHHKGQGRPVIADISGVPNLFGVCVYSFMCHHSLPSLITPIRDKSSLYRVLAMDYLLILGFYALLSFTGIFTFATIQDIYTLNFLPDDCGVNSVTDVAFFEYFLALFPVFTLSTNFPIISITLRNNITTLFSKEDSPRHWVLTRLVFPLVAILPPIAIAFGTNEVEFLVGITGSYAGVGIQYVIPTLLVYYARKNENIDHSRNRMKSPFLHGFWIILIILWSVFCLGFVTVNHIVTRK